MATTHHHEQASVMEAVLAHRQAVSEQHHKGKQQRVSASSSNDDAVAEACLLRDQVVADNGSRLKMQEDLRFLRHQVEAREAKITKISGENESLKCRNEQLKKMLNEKDEGTYCLKVEIAQMKNQYDGLLEENINLSKSLHQLERDLGMGGMMTASSFAESFNTSTAPLSASFKSASLRRPSAISTPVASAPPRDRFAEMMKDKTTIVTLRRKLREQRAVQMEVRRRAEMSTMEAEDQLSAFTGELQEFLYDEGCYNNGSGSTTTTTPGGTAPSNGEEESDGNVPAYYNYSEGPMGRYIPLIRRIYMEGADDETASSSKKPMTNAEARASGAPRLISFKNVKALGHHLEGSLFKQFKIALNQKFVDEHHLENSFKHSPFGQPLSSINMELHRLIKDAKEQSELQVNSMFYIFDELEKRLTVTEKALVSQQGVASASKTSGISIAGALGQLRRGSSGGSIPSTSTLLRRDGSLANPRGDFVEEMKAHVQEFNSAMRRILVCVREGAKRVIGLEGAAKDEWLRKYHAQLQTKEIGTQMNSEEIADPKIGRLEERVEYLNNRMTTITAEHSASLLEFQLQRDKAEVVTKFLQEKLFTLHDGVYECLHTVFKHRVQWISRLPNSFTHLYADIKRLGGESPIFTSVQFNTDVGTAVEEDTKLLRQFAHFFVAGDTYAAVGGAASPLRTQRPASSLGVGNGCASPLGTRKANQRNQQDPTTPGTPTKCGGFDQENTAALEGSFKAGQKTPIGVRKSSIPLPTSTPVANASFGSQSSGSSMLEQLSGTSTKPIPSAISTRKKNNNNQAASTKSVAAGKMVAEPLEFSRKKKEKLALTKAEKQQKQLSVTMKKLLAEEQKAAALTSPLVSANTADNDVTTPLNGPVMSATTAAPLEKELLKAADTEPIVPSSNSNAMIAAGATTTDASKKQTPKTVGSTTATPTAATKLMASSSKPSSAVTTPRAPMQPTAAMSTVSAAPSPVPDGATTSSLPDIKSNNTSRRNSLTLITATPPPSPLKQVGEAGGHFSRNASFANSSFCEDSHSKQQEDTTIKAASINYNGSTHHHHHQQQYTSSTPPSPVTDSSFDVPPSTTSISPPLETLTSRLAPVDFEQQSIRVKSNPASRSSSIDNGPSRDAVAAASNRPPALLLDSITSGLTRKASAPTFTSTSSARQTPIASPRAREQPVAINDQSSTPTTSTTANNMIMHNGHGGTPLPSPRRNSASAAIGSSRRGSMTGSGRSTTAAFAPPVGGSRLQQQQQQQQSSAASSANSSFATAVDSAKTTPRDTTLQAPSSSTATTSSPASSAAPGARRRASTVTVACEYARMASWQRRQTELWQIRREENAKELKRGYESTIITAVDSNSMGVAAPAHPPSSHMPTPPQTPNSASAARTNSNTRPSTTTATGGGSGRVGDTGTALTPRTFSGPF